MNKTVTERYNIEGQDNIDKVGSYLHDLDIPFICVPVDDGETVFSIRFYSARERDEFDNWLGENIF